MRQDSFLDRADRLVRRFTKLISYGAMISLAAIMLLAFGDVVMTKVFHHGIKNATELVQYLNVPVVFLAAAFVEMDRGSTRIELLVNRFPPRLRSFFLCLGDVLGIVFCTYAGYVSLQVMAKKFATHARAMAGQSGSLFLWPFCLILGIGYLSMALAFLCSTAKEIRNMVKGTPVLSEEKQEVSES